MSQQQPTPEAAELEDLSTFTDDRLVLRLQNQTRGYSAATRMSAEFAAIVWQAREQTRLELVRRGLTDVPGVQSGESA